jgi:hypothetical protein
MVLLRGAMFRTVILLAALAAGCSVGEVPLPGSGGDGGGGDGGGALLCAEKITPATAHIHTDDGTDKKGQSCIVGACHLTGNLGPLAPAYTMAGTLYKLDGVTPQPGAEIRFIADAGGNLMIAKTDTAGNFYTGQALPTPGVTRASGCPTADRPMSGKIIGPNDGNCNNGTACHANPGNFIMVLGDQ